MSKVSFPFDLIPKMFRRSGILDPRKKNYLKRLGFIYWAFSKCYTVPSVQEGMSFQPFEFCVGIQQAIKESGLNDDELESQFKFFVDNGFLIKSKNEVKNRSNRYRWNTEKFLHDKFIDLPTQNDESEKNRDQNTSETEENIGTENENIGTKIVADSTTLNNEIKNRDQNTSVKPEIIGTNTKTSEPKSGPNRDQLREGISKKSGPNRDRIPPSIETKNKESLCLKETNINKENVAIPIVDNDLSLFHGEKDLFSASQANEFSEHQKALEAYISYRNIPNITSKVIARWIKNYCIEDIKDALGLMLSAKNVGNPGGWIENVLQKGIVKQERVKKQNINFAKEMQPKNKYLKITSRYCKDIRFSDKEFYFHIDPEIFKSELRKCL